MNGCIKGKSRFKMRFIVLNGRQKLVVRWHQDAKYPLEQVKRVTKILDTEGMSLERNLKRDQVTVCVRPAITIFHLVRISLFRIFHIRPFPLNRLFDLTPRDVWVFGS